MRSYQIDRHGVFWRVQEAERIALPAIITSDREDSNWRVEAHGESDLLRAIEFRCAEPDSKFSVREIFGWATESVGQFEYTANFPQPKHNVQGVMPGFEAL